MRDSPAGLAALLPTFGSRVDAQGGGGRWRVDLRSHCCATCRRCSTAAPSPGLPDRQLLERYSHDRDASADAAFEVLVRRHGPMVLRVCRNVLKDWNDAEDAFQATFIVLARRCGSIRKRDSVESWLFGVACRVAARARVEAARRRAVERRGASEADAALGTPEDDDADRFGARPDRAGRGAPAAGEVPGRGGALLLGGPDAGAGRGAARLPAGHRPQPAGAGTRPVAAAIDPTRSRPAGRRRGIRLRVRARSRLSRPPCPMAGSARVVKAVSRVRGGRWSRHGGRRVGVRRGPGSRRLEEDVDDEVEDDGHRPVVHRDGGRRRDRGGAAGPLRPADAAGSPGPAGRSAEGPATRTRGRRGQRGKSSRRCMPWRTT